MGVMMLNANSWNIRNGEGILSGEVIGMKIIGNRLRSNVKESLEVLDSFFERREGLQILEVSDMVAQKGVLTTGQAERIF